MKNRKKVIIRSLVSAAAILIAITTLLCFRLRSSVMIQAEQAQFPPHDVTAYRQDDAQWADDTLGSSSFTMKSSGCLVCCIASAISMEPANAIDPGALNHIFTEYHVYDNQGNIQWSVIDKINGYSTQVYHDVSKQAIDQCLASGRCPIVRVRMHTIGSFHYVLIVGTENGEYVCMDPLENELTRLSQYGGRVYAIRVVETDCLLNRYL